MALVGSRAELEADEHLATPETALSLLLKLRPRLQQQPAPTATVTAILPDLNCNESLPLEGFGFK
ncbi:hypothetical protein H8959_012528 [Pygathrix nigripes]